MAARVAASSTVTTVSVEEEVRWLNLLLPVLPSVVDSGEKQHTKFFGESRMSRCCRKDEARTFQHAGHVKELVCDSFDRWTNEHNAQESAL
eukprot:IDg7593t1